MQKVKNSLTLNYLKFSIPLIFNLYELEKERNAIYEKLLIDFGSGFLVIGCSCPDAGCKGNQVNSYMESEYLHKCDHCGAEEGKKRPIGKYIVELHPFRKGDKLIYLCMPCYTYYLKKRRKKTISEGKE